MLNKTVGSGVRCIRQDLAVTFRHVLPPVQAGRAQSSPARFHLARCRVRHRRLDGVASAAAEQTPWDSAIRIPSTFQAEDFDLGGEGVAYHDTDAANTGGAYRLSEGVDVRTGTDADLGYEVGNAKPSEWLEYTVNVGTTGVYDIGLRVAAGGSGGRVHLDYLGADVTGPVTIPTTRGWTKWTTVWINGVRLQSSQGGVLRLAFDASAAGTATSIANINSITVRRSTPTTPTPTPSPTPAATPTPTPTSTPTPTATRRRARAPRGHALADADLRHPAVVSTFTPAAPAPTERYEATGVAVGSKVFIFGGFYDYEQYVRTDYIVYDVPTNTWTTLGSLPTGMAQTHLGAATDGRYIYLAGGLGGDVRHGQNPAQWISSRLYRYDNRRQHLAVADQSPAAAWRRRPRADRARPALLRRRALGCQHRLARPLGLPPGRSRVDAGRADAEAKDHFSTAVIGGQIYAVLGEFGHRIGQLQLTSGHRYDPETDTWRRIADAPQAKSHAESSTFVSNGQIIIAGGQTEGSTSTDRSRLQPTTDTWSELKLLPYRRQGAVAEKIGGTFVLSTGGVNPRSPQATTWTGK